MRPPAQQLLLDTAADCLGIIELAVNWEAEKLTTEQQTELQSLQQKFEESKALISNTETALRHYH